MDSSVMCIMLNPKMNSSSILVMNTHVVSGHCPKFSFTKACFKVDKVSPDVCRVNCVRRVLGQSSGHGHAFLTS
jgi:hypothetical protein